MANYTLDIKKPSRQFIIEGLHRGDNGLREFYFHFSDGSNAFTLPTSCIVTLFASLPNGATIYDTCTLYDSNTALYTLKGGAESASITSIAGICNCEIRISCEDGKMLTTPRFAFLIEDTLQNDSAIEAQDSFSALTDALGRVLKSEAGLSSKADKVHGEAGNVAVIGMDGNLCDGNIAPHSLYTFHYEEDGSYNEYNRELFERLLSDHEAHRPFVAASYYYDTLLPAIVQVDADDCVTVLALNASLSRCFKIEISETVLSYTSSDVLSSTFDEEKSTPATQKATADWVKAYVDEAITEGEW